MPPHKGEYCNDIQKNSTLLHIGSLDNAEVHVFVTVPELRPLAGCTPHDFNAPEEALAFAKAHARRMGVVNTDYGMPSMNGIAFVQALRCILELATVPVIMVKSSDQRSLRRACCATDFLAKPADSVEIRARVSSLLALSAAHRTQREHGA